MRRSRPAGRKRRYRAMGHAEVNMLMGEGLAARQQLIETMVALQGQTLTYQTGPIGLDEVVRLDEQSRGDAQPARSAIWIDRS